MKVQRMLAAVITTAVLLSGCTSLSLNDPDILAPPKAGGDRAQVQSMIEKDANGSYTLIYPASGEYKSGIIRHDLNGDDVEEAVALYCAADETPRLLTAMKQGDQYVLYGSTQLHSPNIHKLSFADVDSDGTEEIVISFDFASPLATLEACFLHQGVSAETVAEGFTDYTVGDFDDNASADILLMKPSAEASAAKASLLVYSDGGFAEKSSCDIDSDVRSYADLRFSKISDDMYGAIADGVLENGEYTTQLLYYDLAAHMLVNPLFLNSSYSQSVRDSAVCCTDIDGDDVIEVPLCSLCEHTKDEDAETVCSIVRWCDYDPELMALSFVQSAVLCDRLDFMLQLDAETITTLTARYTADNAITLYALSYKGSEPVIGKELLTVKRYEKNSYDSSLTAEAKLADTTAHTYTYILSEGSPFSHDDIIDSFLLLGAEEIYSN